MQATKQYDTRLDAKRRLTIRGALFEYYHVVEYADGKIVLEPRVLTPPFQVSERTLSMMDSAVANYREGSVSTPVDLSAFLPVDSSPSEAERIAADEVGRSEITIIGVEPHPEDKKSAGYNKVTLSNLPE